MNIRSETMANAYAAARNNLEEMLERCTDEQKDRFNGMYESVERLSNERLDFACLQTERTVAKNSDNCNSECFKRREFLDPRDNSSVKK